MRYIIVAVVMSWWLKLFICLSILGGLTYLLINIFGSSTRHSSVSPPIKNDDDLLANIGNLNAPDDADRLVTSITESLERVAEKHSDSNAAYRKKAILSEGMISRMNRLLLKLASGSSILRAATVGGSITAGHGVHERSDYFSQFNKLLTRALLPFGITTTFHNTALGATSSQYFAQCIDQHLNLPSYDVIFIEFSINDAFTCASIEELVRSIWRINPLMVIIYVHFTIARDHFPEPKPTHSSRPPVFLPCNVSGHDPKKAIHLETAGYYHLPIIQMDHIYDEYFELTDMSRDEIIGNFTSDDRLHPNEFIHRYVAESVLGFFGSSSRKLLETMASTKQTAKQLKAQETEKVKQLWLKLQATPLYSSTWIDGVDCFLSIKRPFKKTNALKRALLDHSPDAGFVDLNPWMEKYVQRGRKLEGELDYLMMPNRTSSLFFRFDSGFMKKSPCGKEMGPYIPRIAFCYRVCNNCPLGKLSIKAKFQFTDGSAINATYHLDLILMTFNLNYVDYPKMNPASKERDMFCRQPYGTNEPMISKFELLIEQRSKSYPFLLHAIAIDYECCT